MTKSIRWTTDKYNAHIATKKPSKLHNHKVDTGDHKFASKAEHRRYLVLSQEEKEGKISELKLQVKFDLTPSAKRSDGTTERACGYIADFMYIRDGVNVVEDCKGFKTIHYILKRKMMLFIHGITIIETK